MAEHGGARENAGRPKGSMNAHTKKKLAVQKAFDVRMMRHVDELFNAQFSLAVGTQRLFRVDEEEVDGKVKRIHTLVTDTEEIKKVLDENSGDDGAVEGKYYYITEVPPDNRAIDSLLNRVLGKPKEVHELTGANGGAIEQNHNLNLSTDVLKTISDIYGTTSD